MTINPALANCAYQKLLQGDRADHNDILKPTFAPIAGSGAGNLITFRESWGI